MIYEGPLPMIYEGYGGILGAHVGYFLLHFQPIFFNFSGFFIKKTSICDSLKGWPDVGGGGSDLDNITNYYG